MYIIIHDYGGYAFSLQLAETLAQNGHKTLYLHGGQMQIVQRSKSSSKVSTLDIQGMPLQKSFPKYSLVKRRQQEIYYGRWLVAEAQKFKPDVIISANAPLDTQNLLLAFALKEGKTFIHWWQDVVGLATKNILMNKNRLLGWLVGEYYMGMERAQLYRSQRVIAIAEEFRPLYRLWGLDERKFRVLPNWAPLEEIFVLPKDNSWARKHGLHEKFVFLYSGVLALKHNPATFTLLADHFRNDPNVIVVVISQGPGADWLAENPRPNLLLFPFQPYEDYPSVLATANVLVAGIEGHAGAYSVPSKVLTYLCAGRPILLLSPPENQAARLVCEQCTGLVASPADIDTFFAHAEFLHQHPYDCSQFGMNARLYAENAFDIQRICAQFLEYIS